MRVRSPRPMRTTLNLADPKQVKSVKKCLGISASDLVRVVDKIGNSTATIQKEVELEKMATLEHANSGWTAIT